MNEKVNKVLHKGGSFFSVLALLAAPLVEGGVAAIPVLAPYFGVFAGLAAVLGGSGLAQDGKAVVSKKK